MGEQPGGRTHRGKGWLRLAAAAELLGVSEHTLRRWADTGTLPVYRTGGGQRRFRRADLVRLLESSSPGARSPGAASVPAPASSQEAWLASLLESSRAVASAPDLESALSIVAERTAQALGSPECIIYEYDKLLDAIVPRAIWERSPSGWDRLGEAFLLAEHPVERRLLETGEPLVERLSDPNLDPASRASLEAWGEVMCLSIPLRFREESRGLLVVFETAVGRDYDDAELAFVTGLGEMAAAAIRNAQLVRHLKERNRRLASLVDAGRAMTSTVVLEDVLVRVAEQATLALRSEQCLIWEYDAERGGLIERAFSSAHLEGAHMPEAFIDLDLDYVTRGILEGGAPVQESVSDPDLQPLTREVMERFGEKTCLSVPLIFGQAPVGLLLLIEVTHERSFSAEERDLAMAIGEQASSAIHNAKLYRRQEEQTRRLTSLLEVGRAITTSVADVDLLSTLAHRAADALGCRGCAIWELDAAGDSITSRAMYLKTPTEHDYLGVTRALDDWPSYRCILEGDAIVVEKLSDPDLDAAVRAAMLDAGEMTRLNLPLRFGGESLGVLALIETEHEREFTAAEMAFARGLGEHAAVAICNARLIETLELRGHEAALLNDIARRAATSLNLRDIAAATIDELRRLTRLDSASLFVAGPSGELEVVFTTGSDDRLPGVLLDELAAGFLPRLESEKVAFLDLPGDWPRAIDNSALEALRSGAIIGLFEEGRVVGALTLGSESPGVFSEVDRRVFEGVGAHLSLAVKNARLYENVKQLHVGGLRALSSALNAKDYYTLGHAARVATYATLLAAELKWAPELIDRVEEVAYLHDIGKISVSDRVLLKPGRLNEEDWRLMREHPAVSAEILQPLLDETLVAGIRHHHEWYDGSGYPDGLAGSRIPALARLLCVVDSYDAMSSRRLYRVPYSYRQCIDELRRCRRTQFDPVMVDAFIRVLERLRGVKAWATAAARDAAARIDAAEHMLVRQPADEGRPEYAHIQGILREVLDAHPKVPLIGTEARLDEHRLTVVVSAGRDGQVHVPLGETLLADEEETQIFAGRTPDCNVVYVDSYGSWISGLAPIVSDEGRIVALVSADIPAAAIHGAPSDMARSFSDMVQSAASRLTRLEIDAMTDFLSGLYNHRYFQDRLSEEVAAALTSGGELSLLFCDIDWFKDYNDLHGHTVGDTALRAVAQVIDRCIRTADIAARYGGDEFAVVLVGTGADVAATVAERIRAGVYGLGLDVGDDRVSVSVGVATLPQDAVSKEDLVQHADWAMYVAKREGRNRVVSYDGVARLEAPAEPAPRFATPASGRSREATLVQEAPSSSASRDMLCEPPAAIATPAERAAGDCLAGDWLAAELAAELNLDADDVLAALKRALALECAPRDQA